ncbi:hypothetical protein SUGI_0311250 [Cryptomeria japonica]|uniref:zinc finger CCCH domain-containing protein 30 n=1 Tax=Cryptomeria japonica TaxID=3369 RepID=UPI002408B5D2|nr:zinc finger CCCH domain-containing protein 30 [Cryptomeria japonica]GLJ17803.1 hypothetical protein SUGI_0311250 [Cryptomeria japonica]
MPSQAEQNKPSRRNMKKVSWAPETNLCQVRLFLAEDAPLQAGQVGVQDQLQAKKRLLWHPMESGFDYDLPPGFGRSVPSQCTPEEPCMEPQTAWRIPPRFVINHSWKVAVGDDSEEIKTQCEREVRFLEAVYPRPSAIPPSPVEPTEPYGELDDSETALIPLTPIEEEEVGDLEDSTPVFSSHESSQSSGNNSSGVSLFGGNNIHGPLLNSTAMQSFGDDSNTRAEEPKNIPTSPSNLTIEPDVAAAAKAAFFAIMRSNEEGSMIDPDLLIKILRNPQIIQTLSAQPNKNDNTQMEGIPTSLPINTNVNGNESTLKFQHELNPTNICKPQATPSVNPGINKSGEILSSNIQAPLNPPISEAKVYVTTELGSQPSERLEFSNARHMPMSSPALVSSSNGLATSQFMPRPATVVLPTSSAQVACQTPKGVTVTAPMITGGPKWTGTQNEQYYKSLIQQHGGPNKNDHVNQNGLQYRKELIHQHGVQQGIERGGQLQPGNLGGLCGVDMNKSKFRKPCLYFNSPKGCRRGSSCTFLHELIERPKIDENDLKRAKIEIEASGRH